MAGRVLSFDVGLYNLAYVILDKDENIIKWDTLNVIDDDIERECANACCGKLKNGTNCKSKVKYRHNGTYHCKKHRTADCTLIQRVKYNSKNSLDIHKNIIAILDKIPELFDVETVVIENQPSLVNPMMKTIQCIIYSYFLMRGIVDKRGAIKNIKHYSARNKMGVYAGPPIECKLKNKYGKRKWLSVRYCEAMLTASPTNKQFLEFFNGSKKQDDLADCFLQGIHFIRKGASPGTTCLAPPLDPYS